jgi:hypothetical protein
MALTGVDEDAAAEIAKRLRQIISNGDPHTEGERVLQALEENPANAVTVTRAILLFKGSDYTRVETRDRVRQLLTQWRDQLLTQELLQSQASLAESTDRLAKRTLVATWVGAVIAAVGVAVAIITYFKA